MAKKKNMIKTKTQTRYLLKMWTHSKSTHIFYINNSKEKCRSVGHSVQVLLKRRRWNTLAFVHPNTAM